MTHPQPSVHRCAYAVALLTFSLLGSAGCSSSSATTAEVVRPVKTLLVVAGDEPQVHSFPGRVDASKRVELAFQVPGLLAQFPVREGQSVAKGDLIGQLRQDEFQARLTTLQGQLDQARAVLRALQAGERPEERLRREAQVRAAEARLANARADYDRFARLLPSRAVAQADYDLAASAYRIAQEDLKSAVQLLEQAAIAREEDIDAKEAVVRGLEGRVVEASIQLADTTLRAPYDGVIAQRFVEQGQNVQAKQPVVRFQDANELEIVVDVPENVMAGAIRMSDIVQLTAEISGAPGLQFPVHIQEIAQVADPTTQTFAVRVAMQAPTDVNILPGMTATVTATYRRASVLGNQIMVPIAAVYQDSNGQQVVWVVGADQKVARRPVKLGSARGGQLEITDGLDPGDRVAIAGVNFLREGMKVRDLAGALGGRP